MSIATDIRVKIIKTVEAGTFKKVTYEKPNTNIPILGGQVTDKPIIWVNETSATIKEDSKNSSMGREFNLGPWNFEARIKFPVEVDTSEFITKELSKIVVHSEGYLITVKVGGYHVDHPVTGGAQTGTQLLLNLIANTRR
jgi:hypothetical protein